jgi:hypothetical protein
MDAKRLFPILTYIKIKSSLFSETGNMLLSLLKEESEVRLRLNANLTLPPVITWQTNQQTAGKVSTFDTWGPSSESYTVTSLLGPGGRVLSTIPRKVGGWGLCREREFEPAGSWNLPR